MKRDIPKKKLYLVHIFAFLLLFLIAHVAFGGHLRIIPVIEETWKSESGEMLVI
jgi:hypothetical protein